MASSAAGSSSRRGSGSRCPGAVAVRLLSPPGAPVQLEALPLHATVRDLALQVQLRLGIPMSLQSLVHGASTLAAPCASLARVFGHGQSAEVTVVRRPLTPKELSTLENGEEELEDLPAVEEMADPLRNARILRTLDGRVFGGRVEKVEVGKLSGERLYRVRYEDDDVEDFTADMVEEWMVTDDQENANGKPSTKPSAARELEPTNAGTLLPQEEEATAPSPAAARLPLPAPGAPAGRTAGAKASEKRRRKRRKLEKRLAKGLAVDTAEGLAVDSAEAAAATPSKRPLGEEEERQRQGSGDDDPALACHEAAASTPAKRPLGEEEERKRQGSGAKRSSSMKAAFLALLERNALPQKPLEIDD